MLLCRMGGRASIAIKKSLYSKVTSRSSLQRYRRGCQLPSHVDKGETGTLNNI